jgi:hypothetical protein
MWSNFSMKVPFMGIGHKFQSLNLEMHEHLTKKNKGSAKTVNLKNHVKPW